MDLQVKNQWRWSFTYLKEIEIAQLEGGAYIEFIYNGMCYQSIPVRSEIENGSKATEGDERQTFNNKFATITNNQATGSAGAIALSYDKMGKYQP